MKLILAARIALTFIGIGVLGYGISTDQPKLRLAAMGIFVIALIMRFVPRRWFEDSNE